MQIEKQPKAKREVAKSTGPKPKGSKTHSRLNALKHGAATCTSVPQSPKGAGTPSSFKYPTTHSDNPNASPVTRLERNEIPSIGNRSLTHCFAPTDLTIDNFEADLFETFADELTQELNPTTRYELALVDRVIDCLWRLRRAGRIESDKLRAYLETPGKSLGEQLFEDDQQKRLSALSSHETRLERSMYRAMKELRELKGQTKASQERAKANPRAGLESQDTRQKSAASISWPEPDTPEPAESLLFLKTKREAVAAAQKQIEDIGALEERLHDLLGQRDELREEIANYSHESRRRRAEHAIRQIEAKLAAYVEAIANFRENKFEATNPIKAIHRWVERKMEVVHSELKRLTNTSEEDSGCASNVPPQGNVEDFAAGETSKAPPKGNQAKPQSEERTGLRERSESGGILTASAIPPTAEEEPECTPNAPPPHARATEPQPDETAEGVTVENPGLTQDQRAALSPMGGETDPPAPERYPNIPPRSKSEEPQPDPPAPQGRLSPASLQALAKLRDCQRRLHEARQSKDYRHRENEIYVWSQEVDRQIYLNRHLIPSNLIAFDPNEPQPAPETS